MLCMRLVLGVFPPRYTMNYEVSHKPGYATILFSSWKKTSRCSYINVQQAFPFMFCIFWTYVEQEPQATFPAAPALLRPLLEILSGSCTLNACFVAIKQTVIYIYTHTQTHSHRYIYIYYYIIYIVLCIYICNIMCIIYSIIYSLYIFSILSLTCGFSSKPLFDF